MNTMEVPRSSHRHTMTAMLMNKPERLETGNGFDNLPQSESLVSVIVPSYAHEEFVEQALRSVTGQTYRNIEVITADYNWCLYFTPLDQVIHGQTELSPFTKTQPTDSGRKPLELDSLPRQFQPHLRKFCARRSAVIRRRECQRGP